MHLKKVSFWTEKLRHMTPKNAYLLFYQIKPNICNLAKCDANKHFYHTIMHATFVSEVCVHISVLLLKQNIC